MKASAVVLVLLLLSVAPSAHEAVRYFPPGSLVPDGNDQDVFARRWFVKHLLAMREPPLATVASGNTVVRLLYLRSFHHPVAVRVVGTDDGARLVGIEADGAGGYDPGAEVRRVERIISAADWHTFLMTLRGTGFWSAPPHIPVIAIDGSHWVLEAREHRTYHVIHRHAGGEVRALGDQLLVWAGMVPPHDELY